MTTRRRKARTSAVEVLYRWDLLGDDADKLIAEVTRRTHLKSGTTGYFQRIVEATLAHQAEIDAMLTQTLKKWKLQRLSYLDRAILRLACCELLFFPDIPPNVSINEAVEIAKSLSDDKSGQFVNGILDAIAKLHPRPAAQPKDA